jgi:hypothetical protein
VSAQSTHLEQLPLPVLMGTLRVLRWRRWECKGGNHGQHSVQIDSGMFRGRTLKRKYYL